MTILRPRPAPYQAELRSGHVTDAEVLAIAEQMLGSDSVARPLDRG